MNENTKATGKVRICLSEYAKIDKRWADERGTSEGIDTELYDNDLRMAAECFYCTEVSIINKKNEGYPCNAPLKAIEESLKKHVKKLRVEDGTGIWIFDWIPNEIRNSRIKYQLFLKMMYIALVLQEECRRATQLFMALLYYEMEKNEIDMERLKEYLSEADKLEWLGTIYEKNFEDHGEVISLQEKIKELTNYFNGLIRNDSQEPFFNTED